MHKQAIISEMLAKNYGFLTLAIPGLILYPLGINDGGAHGTSVVKKLSAWGACYDQS
jgi:hypothetical protein